MHQRGRPERNQTPEFHPDAEVRCEHVQVCGACPLMFEPYEAQCSSKRARLEAALAPYGMTPSTRFADVQKAELTTHYRRRAKLVVARDEQGAIHIGLYGRHDNQSVVDIPQCQVLSSSLLELVEQLRELATAPADELKPLLATVGPDEEGVLMGIDAREVQTPEREGEPQEQPTILLTLILMAERAAESSVLREAGRALRRALPQVSGVAATLRYGKRQQGSSEFVVLSGQTEAKDSLEGGYQYISHTSFVNVHRPQADKLYEMLRGVVSARGENQRILDLYGGTGAIALTLASAGHQVTMVESYPPAAALAQRAGQAQRLQLDVVTGDVASVTKALAVAGSPFDVVIANPPRRGLSPAARESIASLQTELLVYIACDLHNLTRDLEHLQRLGYRLRELTPIDMLPLTDEVEAVAIVERAPDVQPQLLYEDEEIIAFNKPPHEPVQDQPEYPNSLVSRAREYFEWGDWVTVLRVEASTSGLCVFAKDEATATKWIDALHESGRLVYLAAARGVTPAKGAITRELRGEKGSVHARTRYRRLAIGGGHSILRVVPEKRYTHQIRRHLAAIGHPVLGDARYGHGPTNRYFEEKHGLDRSFLHLIRLEVNHPLSGERLLIEAPLPPGLRTALVRASDESVLKFLEKKSALGESPPRLGERQSSPPNTERSPLSMREPGRESIYPTQAPMTVRSGGDAIDLDEAPRTVRGELISSGED